MFIKLQVKDQQRFHFPDVEFVPPVEGQKKLEYQLRLEATKPSEWVFTMAWSKPQVVGQHWNLYLDFYHYKKLSLVQTEIYDANMIAIFDSNMWSLIFYWKGLKRGILLCKIKREFYWWPLNSLSGIARLNINFPKAKYFWIKLISLFYSLIRLL